MKSTHLASLVFILLLFTFIAKTPSVNASGGFGGLNNTWSVANYKSAPVSGTEQSVSMNADSRLLSVIIAIQQSISKIAGKTDTAQWIATIVASILGLLGIWRAERLIWRPKFKILTRRPGALNGVKVAVKAVGVFQYYAYYFGFRVINDGNYQMEDVEAIVDEVYKLDANNVFIKDVSFLPQNLVWSNLPGVFVMPKIQSKFYKSCDFGHITEKEHAGLEQYDLTSDSKVVCTLDTFVHPNTGSSLLFPGEYKIKVVFAASYIKSLVKWYRLKILDVWSEDENYMLTNNMSFEETTAPTVL